ncbi:kinase [Phenylobacterium sp.]|uniref:kinase n=1 Tax=Phenylobacterium sp. TaxID=1871053 RepID=UPI0028A1443A|nr:kinase [Phenylobacterium sp.]
MTTEAWLARFMAAERLPERYAQVVRDVAAPLAGKIAAAGRPGGIVVGICGAQASGKSTLTAVLRRLLEERGLTVALFSLDDLYLTRGQRQALAREAHPLLAVRGVPGTHDVALGARLLAELRRPGLHELPAFDKARDDRREAGTAFAGPADVVLFEGWCVGAAPQPPQALAAPVNALEAERDPDGVWRRYVNAALAGPYQALFRALDLLILLQAPSFEVVLDWRIEQERKLRERLAREGGDASRVMSDAQVGAFIAHYERLTRWILEEMPGRADLVVALDAERRPSLRA